MASQFRTRDYRPFGLVHVNARGFNRQRIIFDDADRAYVLSRLRSLLNLCLPADRPRLLAYALMDNHLHFLFQNGAVPTEIQRVMHVFKRDFARRFNDQRGRSGPVWESPFRGRVVRGGDDLINVVTYIHLNPGRSARMTNSSHAIYLGIQPPGIVSTDLVLKAFGGAEAYRDFFDDTAKIRAARAAAKRRTNQ